MLWSSLLPHSSLVKTSGWLQLQREIPAEPSSSLKAAVERKAKACSAFHQKNPKEAAGTAGGVGSQGKLKNKQVKHRGERHPEQSVAFIHKQLLHRQGSRPG